MNGGQGILGEHCAWCEHAAVKKIELEPARYSARTVVDPQTGETRTARVLVHRAIVVPVCDDHKYIRLRQGLGMPIDVWRRKHARDVDQLSFDE